MLSHGLPKLQNRQLRVHSVLPLACQERGETEKMQAKCIITLLGGIRVASEQGIKIFNAKESIISEAQNEKIPPTFLSFNSIPATPFLQLLYELTKSLMDLN